MRKGFDRWIVPGVIVITAVVAVVLGVWLPQARNGATNAQSGPSTDPPAIDGKLDRSPPRSPGQDRSSLRQPGSGTGSADEDAGASERDEPPAISWGDDLEAGLKQAKEQSQLVAIDFYADWCIPCKKMEQSTFEDAEVRRRLQEFVTVKIDVDEQKDLAERYGVQGLPTSLIVDPSGERITGEVGYLGAEGYLAFLDRADEGEAGSSEEGNALNRAGAVGGPAPSWGVERWLNLPKDQNGLDVDDFEGKVTYILGFQTWCPGCHKVGFPNLKKTMARYEDNDDVRFVAIQTAFEGFGTNSFRGAKRTAKELNLEIPVGHSGGPNSPSKFMQRYRTRGTPWVVVIDQRGIIRHSDFHLPVERAAELIDRLLTRKGPQS